MVELPGLKTSFRHGSRSRYVIGCRCRPCTHANLLVYHEREKRAKELALELGPRTGTHCAGVHGKPCPHGTKLRKDSTGNLCMRCRRQLVWNGLVPAKAARHHLLLLSNAGIGRKSVQAATDINGTTLQLIRSGKRKQIHAKTEQLILAVDRSAIADRGFVNARPTWDRVARLRRMHGYTLAEISRRIGQGGRRLQLGKKRVTARNALKIEKLLRDAEGDFLQGGH